MCRQISAAEVGDFVSPHTEPLSLALRPGSITVFFSGILLALSGLTKSTGRPQGKTSLLIKLTFPPKIVG